MKFWQWWIFAASVFAVGSFCEKRRRRAKQNGGNLLFIHLSSILALHFFIIETSFSA